MSLARNARGFRFRLRDEASGDSITVYLTAVEPAAAVRRLRALLGAAAAQARSEGRLDQLLHPIGQPRPS